MRLRLMASVILEAAKLLMAHSTCQCQQCTAARRSISETTKSGEEMSTTESRFELGNDQIGVIGHFPSREEALKVAVPGDYLYDRMAQDGGIELWIVGGDLDHKTLRQIRRKMRP